MRVIASMPLAAILDLAVKARHVATVAQATFSSDCQPTVEQTLVYFEIESRDDRDSIGMVYAVKSDHTNIYAYESRRTGQAVDSNGNAISGG